ncbi:hypothetical protein [Bradyrhizobium sp. AZCC 1721]|uniref:hypothetical protein n=1 Tax=Bradyrhizobium sp. AZCC 1721 TaxID=3117016 RepID=UPI002FF14A2F
MNETKSELVTYLESVDGPDRARVLWEAGLAGLYDTTDPDLTRLCNAAAGSGNEWSRRLSAIMPQPPRRTREQFEHDRRWQRVRHHYPLTKPCPWVMAAALAQDEESAEKEYGTTLPAEKGSASAKVIQFDPDPLAAALGRHLYEHAREMWPHFIGPLPYAPPPRYQRPGAMVNPFRVTSVPRQMKSSFLTSKDVQKVYDAMAYGMWKDGTVLNAHAVIIWSMMGLSELEGCDILGRYLNEARKWVNVGGGFRGRRLSARSPLTKVELKYVYVHENAPGRGFHSHVLMNLPPVLRNEFDAWSRSCLVRLTGRNIHRDAYRLVRSYGKTKAEEVRTAWRWFRYVVKQLHPNEQFAWKDHAAREIVQMNGRDILNPWSVRTAIDVQQIKLTGASHNIGKKARDQDGFRSRLYRSDIDNLYAGLELEEGKSYREQEAEQEELLKTLQI